MSVTLPIASRRGACPTLHEPMQTGDGLLARLRIEGGRFTPSKLTAIASLALEFGNGQVEITARGNLQVRGLTPSSAGPFAVIVDAISTIEHGLVVEVPPLAGDDPTELADPRPLAEAIGASATALAGRLGPKVTVVTDGAGRIGLDDLKADIRVRAVDATRWSVTLGGAQAQVMDADSAIATTIAVLGALAAMGPDARATDLFPQRLPGTPLPSSPPIGRFDLRHGYAIGIALPFGGTDYMVLGRLGGAALHHGITELRLAPHHGLLAINAPAAFVADAAALGLITSADDPRCRVSACIGRDGCASGHIPARAIAARLAPYLRAGQHLHVSGCAKGCAHPRAADVTLVGRADGYGLVIDGVAGDMPASVLHADQLEAAVAARQG